MNINGFCPQCNADFDGDLIVDTFLKQGNSKEEALSSAQHFTGWDEHKELNRWSKKISIYNHIKDKAMSYRCIFCSYEWSRYEK